MILDGGLNGSFSPVFPSVECRQNSGADSRHDSGQRDRVKAQACNVAMENGVTSIAAFLVFSSYQYSSLHLEDFA